LVEAKVAPAPPTTDFEFIRRVSLDLTGRIPTAEAVVAFVADLSSDKRTRLVDQLLASPQWIDKWTMWFGDLYENNSRNNLAANRYVPGVKAFNRYMRSALSSGKPYNQIATELISASGSNSYEQGNLNFLVGSVMGNGPIQDTYDKQIAFITKKFLGISDLDCLLCHDGRGHLDSLSLWGYYATRQQAYGMASFMSHTATVRLPVTPGEAQPYYWAIEDDARAVLARGIAAAYRAVPGRSRHQQLAKWLVTCLIAAAIGWRLLARHKNRLLFPLASAASFGIIWLHCLRPSTWRIGRLTMAIALGVLSAGFTVCYLGLAAAKATARVGLVIRTVDYQLNTRAGNRPPRGPIDSAQTVAPAYIFDGEGPQPGEPYRVALARKLTSDPQFARAIVNYLWEFFFGIGIVTPSSQFDPYRLDPNHPPTGCPLVVNPCTLQPSHPRLLNELSQEFINHGYNLRWLMRTIVNSRAYQLSSRYEGRWDPVNNRLFARKLVRRLWSEEIHDAIVQSHGVPVTYNNSVWGPVNWAMQFPEPLNTPERIARPGEAVRTDSTVMTFLNVFLRGNRDDQKRNGDVSVAQALALMNDPFVVSRLGTNTGILAQVLPLPDDRLIKTLYLTVLSRYPTPEEHASAMANLKAPNNRAQEAQFLLWSLYNKVDFIFNY